MFLKTSFLSFIFEMNMINNKNRIENHPDNICLIAVQKHLLGFVVVKMVTEDDLYFIQNTFRILV